MTPHLPSRVDIAPGSSSKGPAAATLRCRLLCCCSPFGSRHLRGSFPPLLIASTQICVGILLKRVQSRLQQYATSVLSSAESMIRRQQSAWQITMADVDVSQRGKGSCAILEPDHWKHIIQERHSMFVAIVGVFGCSNTGRRMTYQHDGWPLSQVCLATTLDPRAVARYISVRPPDQGASPRP